MSLIKIKLFKITIIFISIIILSQNINSMPHINKQNQNINNLLEQDIPNIDWELPYGNSMNEYPTTIFQTKGGGYVISSTIELDDINETRAKISKINHNGYEIWNKTYGNEGQYSVTNIQENNDEHLILFGNSNNNNNNKSWVIKTDALGNVLWEKSFQYGEKQSLNKGIISDDKSYLFVGTITSNGNSDIWVVKISSIGNLIWQKTFDISDTDTGISICKTSNSDYIILGGFIKELLIGSAVKIYLLKIDDNGNQIDENSIGNSFLASMSFGNSICNTPDGGCIIAGFRNYFTNLGKFDYTLWKLSPSLELQDEWNFFSSNDFEMLTSVISYDSGYMAVGNNIDTKDSIIIKIDSYGNTIDYNYLGGDENDMIDHINNTNDDSFIISGSSKSFNQDKKNEIWLIKYEGVNTPPTIEIINPKNEDVITEDIIISGISSDKNGYNTIEKVEICIDDNIWDSAVGTLSWTYFFSLNNYENGAHLISARSFDGEEYSSVYSINVQIEKNNPPFKPNNPFPDDHANDVGLNTLLSVDVFDPEGDTMDVSFYQIDGTLIGCDYDIVSGDTASIEWGNLNYNTSYNWYAVADDGDYQNQSIMWEFKTIEMPNDNQPPFKPVNPIGPIFGYRSQNYSFTTWTFDPNGDELHYGWDWDNDSTIDTWTEYTESGSSINTNKTWYVPGFYSIKVKAEDIHDLESNFSSIHEIEIKNKKPDNPGKPEGPEEAITGRNYTFTTSAIDPEKDDIKIGISWMGGNDIEFWSDSYYKSGENYSFNITFEEEGLYFIRAIAEDIFGEKSFYSLSKSVWVINENHPPSFPILSGKNNGTINQKIEFHSFSTDKDDDKLKYFFDWGDGSHSGWIGPYEEGIECKYSYQWKKIGTYKIRVKSKDEQNRESSWSNIINLTIYPNIQVSFIGGLTLKTIIKNYDFKKYDDIHFELTIDRKILKNIHIKDIIEKIPIKGIKIIKTKEVFGITKSSIKFNLRLLNYGINTPLEFKKECYLIGKIIIIK